MVAKFLHFMSRSIKYIKLRNNCNSWLQCPRRLEGFRTWITFIEVCVTRLLLWLFSSTIKLKNSAGTNARFGSLNAKLTGPLCQQQKPTVLLFLMIAGMIALGIWFRSRNPFTLSATLDLWSNLHDRSITASNSYTILPCSLTKDEGESRGNGNRKFMARPPTGRVKFEVPTENENMTKCHR